MQLIMWNKKIIAFAAAVPLILFFSTAESILSAAQNNQDEDQIKKIIRLDLLKPKTKEIVLPVRNIFTGQKINETSASDQGGSLKKGISAGDLGLTAELSEKKEGLADREKTMAFNLKYLGYIASMEKKVALIFYEGEILAVEKGAILPGRVEVVDVAVSCLVVREPGSEKLVIKLEGEEK